MTVGTLDPVHGSDGNVLRLLGGFRLESGGLSVALAPTAQRVLALLALRTVTSRQDACGLLWPDRPEGPAMTRLRGVLWQLSRSGPGLVVSSGTRLQLSSSLEVDHSRWRRQALAAVADPAVCDAPEGTCQELLPGWQEEWLVADRERARQLSLHLLERCSERLAASGRYAEALDAALAALYADPLRESAHRIMIGIHVAEGNLGEATAAYRRYQTVMASELGLRPSPAIRGLIAQAVPAGMRTGPGDAGIG